MARAPASPCGQCGSLERYPSGGCKPCQLANTRRRRQAEYQKEYRKLHPERVAQYQKKSRTPERRRHHALKSWHNITFEQYEAMELAQCGKCAICGGNQEDKILQVDHDHNYCPGKQSCGQCVRGLLCFPCNAGIGMLRDNTNTLREAIKYLEEFS